MPFDPELHHRRSIRLRGFDYTRPGSYFITICAYQQTCLFGRIVDAAFSAGPMGKMVRDVWSEIPGRYPGVALDTFVLMPNHLHGILTIQSVAAGGSSVLSKHASVPIAASVANGAFTRTSSLSIPEVVQRFKSFTTAQFRLGCQTGQWQSRWLRLWQRNYFEHIISDVGELIAIREYIERNPLTWEIDRDNPMCCITEG
ncbi:MAG: transposase [Terriglobia bacterium]